MVPSPTPYDLPFIEIGGLQLSYPPLISGTGKATEFKFGGYIYRANPNKSPLKIFGEKGAWAYPGPSRDCPNFVGAPYYLRSG